ncbi:MAG: tryptophan halogenase family protein [Marinicella sp.]
MLPQVHEFHRQLGIDEKAFMRATEATFKLATIYQDWNKDGHRYIQPLGPHGAATEFIGFQHYATKMHQLGDTTAYSEYALSAVAAENNRFMHPQSDPSSIFSTMAYSLHVNSAAYKQYLVDQMLQGHVHFNTEHIVDVNLDENNGFIKSISLENGDNLKADLFIDCSGNDASLIEKVMGVKLEDWSSWLPADRVLSVSIKTKGEVMPYTQVSGKTNGWFRHVPLLNTVERDFVFNSEEVSVAEASEIITAGLSPNSLSEPTLREIHSGQRQQHWHKNCIAFGSAAGDFESLEVSSLQLVQMAVQRFINLFPDRSCNQTLVDEYNGLTHLELDNIRDYMVLHYLSVTRKDSTIWNQWRQHPLPDSLNNKVSLFNIHGQTAFYELETFQESARASTFIGLDMWPDKYDPFLDAFDIEDLKQRFNYMRAAIRDTVINMPSHRLYLEKYCELNS